MEFLKKAIKHYPVIVIAAVAVIIFGAVMGVRYLTNDQRSPEMTLEKYYKAFYEQQDINGLLECSTPELANAVYETYGIPYIGESTILSMHAQQILNTVGYDDFSVQLEMLENTRSDSQVLKNVRQTYPDATAYHIVKFRLHFAGDMDKASATAETCLVKREDGRWYLVDSQIFLTMEE